VWKGPRRLVPNLIPTLSDALALQRFELMECVIFLGRYPGIPSSPKLASYKRLYKLVQLLLNDIAVKYGAVLQDDVSYIAFRAISFAWLWDGMVPVTYLNFC